MTDRLRVGVIGGGLIAQVEHIPNLCARPDLFDVRCVSDPSAAVRDALARRWGLAAHAAAADVLAETLDAVVIAAPDPWHASLCEAALSAGLHVLCEKPICYAPAEVDALIAARDRADRVVQVGTMKRFDPNVEAAAELVRGRAAALRYVGVEVHDPDSWPFVAHHGVVAADDVPAELREETRERQRAQVSAALGFAPSAVALRGITGPFCSSLVHDVNLGHMLLEAAGVTRTEPVSAEIFSGGQGGRGSVRLDDGAALWTLAHVAVPQLAEYRERVTLFFEDGVVELTFPSPYLNHFPTTLTASSSDGHRLETRTVRVGYGEAFHRELEAFHAAVTRGGPRRNTLEEARRDQALLIGLTRLAAAGAG